MRFKVLREKILDELQLLQGVVEKRTTMPILANILIEAKENQIEMTGTDLEVGFKTKVEAEVEEEGALTISGKRLFDIVKLLPEEQKISFIEKNDLVMEIKCGKSQFKVLCMTKEDYPLIPEAKFEKKIILPLEKFKEMIDRVYYAIAQEQRYYLNGALFIVKNKKIDLVSTDGHRLAYTSEELPELDYKNEIRVIIAKKTLAELRKLNDTYLDFDLDENNLFFRSGQRILISRLIETKFPNFEAVIPKNNPVVLFINKEAFINAIRRVALITTERAKAIKLEIEGESLKLFSSNPEIGEARDEIEIEHHGPNLEIGFNSQYLLDFLTNVDSSRIKFELKDENSAALMTPENMEGSQYLYVLMPMKF
ncbi:MAG: DNA polymerase III subunit beta [Candidatus Aminicenantes bacterium]|nr:DNA polymerase III subunit beta [Candidatus Aminicenantes bacterium]